jgi:ABC-type microcin C transport system permease subunit YejB
MYAYILRRLLLIVPTLFGIMVINFVVVQFVPGGPVEQMIAKLTGDAVAATRRAAKSRRRRRSKPVLAAPAATPRRATAVPRACRRTSSSRSRNSSAWTSRRTNASCS